MNARPLSDLKVVGSAEAVRLIVRAGARVDAADADTETPLGLALGEGHVASTEVLLTAGADAGRAYRSIGYDAGSRLETAYSSRDSTVDRLG